MKHLKVAMLPILPGKNMEENLKIGWNIVGKYDKCNQRCNRGLA